MKSNAAPEKASHTFGPFYDKGSEILILGSFPSVKSREVGFYYGHPTNRFWKVISDIFQRKEPAAIKEKQELLISCHIALYDVIDSCEIIGSADSSITDVKVTDLTPILNGTSVGSRIFVNGKTAYRLYMKYQFPIYGIRPICLPSTSAANARYRLDDLIRDWQVIDPGMISTSVDDLGQK
ncbi:MAG: DNA-deoxyinosine glycosylase [Lachnospiraceae bacterium]|nr:DNA-deoxyinosine glycosylase [Lachnospiraceae bacterium]